MFLCFCSHSLYWLFVEIEKFHKSNLVESFDDTDSFDHNNSSLNFKSGEGAPFYEILTKVQQIISLLVIL